MNWSNQVARQGRPGVIGEVGDIGLLDRTDYPPSLTKVMDHAVEDQVEIEVEVDIVNQTLILAHNLGLISPHRKVISRNSAEANPCNRYVLTPSNNPEDNLLNPFGWDVISIHSLLETNLLSRQLLTIRKTPHTYLFSRHVPNTPTSVEAHMSRGDTLTTRNNFNTHLPHRHLPTIRKNHHTHVLNEILEQPTLLSAGGFIDNILRRLDNGAEPYLSSATLTNIFNRIVGVHPEDLTADILTEARFSLTNAVASEKLRLRELRRDEDIEMSLAPGASTLDQFLADISRIIREKNDVQLQDYLVIEPPFGNIYLDMINELKQKYPKGSEKKLEATCEEALPKGGEDQDGPPPWTAFTKFLVQYFGFIRDVNIENLLQTYELLCELVKKSISALGHPTLGFITLPTVFTFSRLLARLAMGLDKKPELIVDLTEANEQNETGSEGLPEKAANIIRQAFVTCLNDRTGGPGGGMRNGVPEGKKTGIYKFANLCLKVFFACRKSRNAEQIFVNIYNQSPPLSAYPKAERITYLYYLGRFLFATNHFYTAQFALQEAYNTCHVTSLNQKRLILIYLIASNMILGRFPSQNQYSKPETTDLRDKFEPICKAIALGDISTFNQLTDSNNANANWLAHYHILLQIKNRCEVLVWRSLARKTFILNGVQGDTNTKRAPTLSLEDYLALLRLLQNEWLAFEKSTSNDPWLDYIDPEFAGVPGLTNTETFSLDIMDVECIFASLIRQGLLNGYLSHSRGRFAIQGLKKAGNPLKAGFPRPWRALKARASDEVPGWKKDLPMLTNGSTGNAKIGGGSVVKLSGARPAGATR
ncbi:MAG: hypothetical protein M1831_005329 [Alyxoria varia]|nr:MAG: hypothetical protein M1831_005329 [Alyxoria varia]